MRCYFLSCERAALKINGAYLGLIDGFERHVELSLRDNLFCEAVPAQGYLPVTFFIDEKLLSSPPDCLDVYRLGGDALIYVREYAPINGEIQVHAQRRFGGALVTVFSQGRTYLSADGENFGVTPLPPEFRGAEFSEMTICGLPVLRISAGEKNVLLSDRGEVIFSNRGEVRADGVYLEARIPFETCTQAYAICTYRYDGRKLTLIKSVTRESSPPAEEVVHFAFFEAVLTRGQYEKYLSPALKEKAEDIYSYLGTFAGVCVPPSVFFEKHGDMRAAGLIYPAGKNIYDVKNFAVELDGGLIDNIFPVD